MDQVFLLAVQNTLVAALFALAVYGLGRFWRNPPVMHWLWLLVLLKLVAPPVMQIDWPSGPVTATVDAGEDLADAKGVADIHAGVVDRTVGQLPLGVSAILGTPRRPSDRIIETWSRVRPVVFWTWIAGTCACALVATARIVRFERRLREMLPASSRLEGVVAEGSGRLGIRRVPAVRIAEGTAVPFLWCAGRGSTIVLPLGLANRLDDQRLQFIVAHELAHLRRRDHWVRLIELVVSAVHWWNPLVWVVRRQIHQSEDVCCDAWVCWLFPDRAAGYAEVLFEVAQSLDRGQAAMPLLPASPFLRSHSLKRRIEMIVANRFAPTVSNRAALTVALVAMLLLPSFFAANRTTALAASKEDAATAKSSVVSASQPSLEFPHAVRFEQGATRFANGDKITIQEIRGTSETFSPGNIYWIKGTYTLASRPHATLAAYTTARDSENGRGISYKVQTAVVEQGEGTFTLILPMSCRGWPHVSFYPADGGEGFGGNYFGTGESVLKRWWGEKE